VGVTGYVVNLAVFAGVISIGGDHRVAAVVAFVVAWSNNFVLNRRWTFDRRDESGLIQGSRYLLVSLTALAVNLLFLEILVRAGVPDLLAQAFAIVVTTPVSFVINRRWTFR
jgi:putative flippase GtrA